MQKQVLLTGGTGLVGTALTGHLLHRGYRVAYLVRGHEKHLPARVKTYRWNPGKNEIEDAALLESHYLVHLAGANVGKGRWTDDRKVEIITSRTDTIRLVARRLKALGHSLEACVSASATGYYGASRPGEVLTEKSVAGEDFLSDVCVLWEAAADEVARLGIRTARLRTGVVLSRHDGALPLMSLAVRLGVGSPLGSGQQYMSWVQLDDLCRMYAEALEGTRWQGDFNAVSPQPVTNAMFMHAIGKALDRRLWAPNVPKWVLKAFMGEAGEVVTGSLYVENQRLQAEVGFRYAYPDLDAALAHEFRRHRR